METDTTKQDDVALGGGGADEDPFAGVDADDPSRIAPSQPGVADGSLAGEGEQLPPEEPEEEQEAPGGAEDGQEAPEEDEVAAKSDVAPKPERAKPKAKGGDGGAQFRDYLVFEEVTLEDGRTAFVKREFEQGSRKISTIEARNTNAALSAVARLLEPGYEGRLVPVSVNAWRPREVKVRPAQGTQIEIG